MNRAQIAVPLPDDATARAVHAALLPEAAEGPEGTTIELRLEGEVLRADVAAPDVSTLRAALNSVLRLLDAARRSM